MPFCTACGAEVGDENAYCTACGERLAAGTDGDAGGGGNGDDGGGDDGHAGNGGDGTGSDGDDGGAPAKSPADSSADDAAGAPPSTGSATATDEETDPGPTEAATRGRQLAAAGVGIAGIAAFLPWVEMQAFGGTISKAGIDGDGKITLAFVILAGIVLLVGKGAAWTRKSRGTVFVLGVLTALIGLYYLNDPLAGTNPSSGARNAVSRGNGLYLTALGGALLVVGPLYATIRPGE